MLSRSTCTKALIPCAVLLLVLGCGGTPPTHVALGDTWTNHNRTFRVISGERYTESRTVSDYIYYDEVVLVALEWQCLAGNAGNECTTGGYQFSLVGENNGHSFENVTFKDQVMQQFGISLPSDVLNCCGMIRYPQTVQVYLLFSVDCASDLVLKYPASSGESESGSVYYAELPGTVQCTR